MPTLSVLRFKSPEGAESIVEEVAELANGGALEVHGAGIVSWESGGARPEGRRLERLSDSMSMSEVFWGMLFGLIFFMPLAATAIGSAAHNGTCSLADFGISDSFVKDVRRRLTDGTSCLFLFTVDATVDRVIALLSDFDFSVMSTNLTNRQEDALRAAFSSVGHVGKGSWEHVGGLET